MKKYFILLVLAYTTVLFAQNKRFIYEYKYIPDATVRDTVRTDIMMLDVDKNGSTYYSKQKFINDSLQNVMISEQLKSGRHFYRWSSTY